MRMRMMIKKLLKTHRYTQVEAAKLIGCTQNSISTWENGKSPPCPKMFMKIINAYGLPHYYFADMNIEKLKLQSRRQNRNIRYDDVDLV